ncbi:MAG: hypothetical protein NC453_11780 [Muribaculum sp.]|nr:hypothetical protein [Muribaculum sp.]
MLNKLFFILFALSFSYDLSAKGRTLMLKSNIDSLCNAELKYHYPTNYILNPIITADKEWELNANGDPYAAPFSGGVWYDEEENLFKMWYSAGGGKKHGLIACYAISEDGKDWHKPTLDYVQGTNIIDTLEHDCFTVLLDKHEQDRKRRYKMFTVRFDSPSAVSMVLKYSSDGIHWSDPVAVSGDLFDRCSAFYDPFRHHYVLSLKTKDVDNRRARNYLANEDPEMVVSLAHRVKDNLYDRNIKFWFSADDNDPRHPDFPEIVPAIYNHDAIAYEGILLGQFNVWQGPENKDCVRLNVQKRNEILLGYSEDGFNWYRPDHHPFIGVDSCVNAWNAGNIQSSMGSPIIVGDSLYFYYSARYNSRPSHPSNFSTGLATIRRDGFISVSGDRNGGWIITNPILVDGEHLFVNIDCRDKTGSFSVELLDVDKRPIYGFETRELHGINKTKYKCDINERLLYDLKGKYVRLKITVRNADLYSYWISCEPSGESGGYTAGGGPGLSSSGKDMK